ncbi:MAG: radical SAM protein [Planctomycetes bacterium]|nr:radical SAM protein [Planctomycetota bacterium]
MPVLRTTRFLRVKLDMVHQCQLRCIMCHFAHPTHRPTRETMGVGLLERVAAQIFPISHDVTLSSSAEPLLARELPRALRLCRDHGVPSFHFSTNAIALDAKVMATILETQMPMLTISVDGATKVTFEAIRWPMRWERLLERLSLVRRMKEQARSRYPVLTVTSVLLRRNIREMPDLVRLMRGYGVEKMNFVHVNVIGGLGVERESLAHEAALCNEMLADVRRVAADVGMHVMTPLPVSEAVVSNGVAPDDPMPRSEAGIGAAIEAPAASAYSNSDFINHKNGEFLLAAKPNERHARPCYFPWYYLQVNPNGTVFPCGSWYELSSFGSLATHDFGEIWRGARFRELRRQLVRRRFRDVCANCPVSNMGRPDVAASYSDRMKVERRA